MSAHLIPVISAICCLVPQASQAAPGPSPTQSVQSLPDWRQYMESMAPIGERVLPQTLHPDDSQSRQETWRILMGTLAQGFVAHVYADPDYPEFISLFNTALNLAAPNPDYMYTWTPLRDAGIYRIKGFRNTVHFAEFTLGQGFYALGTQGPPLGTLDLDSLKKGVDGSFEVILSATRPQGYMGDWWKMPKGTESVVLRQASYDWIHERDADISIERVDAPARRPRLSAADLSSRLADLSTWVEKGSLPWYGRLRDLQQKGLENRLAVHDYLPSGGAIGQIYLEGWYNIRDDEALIVETEVPKRCRYWSFLVTDDQFATVDWMNTQSSLNGYQAKLDTDGKFRGVIAIKDPGVANWLDTGGYHVGAIQVRWNQCDSAPQPTVRKVLFSELRNYLPKDTPVVTPEQRESSLRERRMGAQFRRRW